MKHDASIMQISGALFKIRTGKSGYECDINAYG